MKTKKKMDNEPDYKKKLEDLVSECSKVLLPSLMKSSKGRGKITLIEILGLDDLNSYNLRISVVHTEDNSEETKELFFLNRESEVSIEEGDYLSFLHHTTYKSAYYRFLDLLITNTLKNYGE